MGLSPLAKRVMLFFFAILIITAFYSAYNNWQRDMMIGIGYGVVGVIVSIVAVWSVNYFR